MKSVEWFKSYNETPRFVLMNSLNNASVSLALDEHSNEICTLSSDHRYVILGFSTSQGDQLEEPELKKAIHLKTYSD